MIHTSNSSNGMGSHVNKQAIDYSALLRACLKRWWWFAISLVLFIGLGALYKYVTLPKVEVEANVIVRPEKGSLGSIASQFDIGAFDSQSQEVDDEMAVLSSYSVIRDVVKQMKLNTVYTLRKNLIKKEPVPENSPLELFYDANIADTLKYPIKFKVKVNDKQLANINVECGKRGNIELDFKDRTLPATVKTPYGLFVINTTKFFEKGEDLREDILVLPYGYTTELYQKDIRIYIPSKRSNVIRLLTVTETPDFTKKIINNIIAAYQDHTINVKKASQNHTLTFIDDRLKSLTGELSMSEGDIERFKRDNKLTDFSSDIKYTMEMMGQVQQNLMGAETQLELINMARRFLSNPSNKHNLIPTMGENSSSASQGVMLPGVDQYNSLILQRMELANNAKGDNSMLRKLDERLDAMRENVSASLDRLYSNQQTIVSNLNQKNSESLSRISNIPSDERQYINIKRQQEIQQRIFMYLLQLREETSLNMAKAEPRSEIIDKAFTHTEPKGLGFKKLLVILFVLGMGVPFTAIFLLYKLRSKFSTKSEVSKITPLPIYGEICVDNSGERVVVTGANSTSSTAELFRLIRANLKFALSGSNKVLLVTSTTSGEGKSFVSVNLAYTFALLGKKVLLIGADIRKPRLAEYLGIRPRFGLTEYLSNDDLTIEDITNPAPNCNSLSVIAAGPVPPNPAELLDSAKLHELFKKFRQEYDYIIIDSAPVGMVSDTFSIAPLADVSLYVCRADYTHIKDLQYATEVYDEQRLPRMGLVINGTKITKGYGYGYGEHHDLKRHRK